MNLNKRTILAGLARMCQRPRLSPSLPNGPSYEQVKRDAEALAASVAGNGGSTLITIRRRRRVYGEPEHKHLNLPQIFGLMPGRCGGLPQQLQQNPAVDQVRAGAVGPSAVNI